MKICLFIFFFLIFRCFAAGQNTDLDLLERWHQGRNPGLDKTMNAVSFSVYPVSAAIPLGQIIHGLIKKDLKSLENGFQSATALAVNTAFTYGLKYTIRRDRPYKSHPGLMPYEYDASPSFPSGHVSFAFTTATNLSFQYRKWYMLVPAWAYAGAAGYSRIHLGAHYPSDVIAGAAVGVASAFISHKGNQWIKGYFKKKRQRKLPN